MNRIEAARYLAQRKYAFGSDDNIEIDETAEVAPVDSGIWVQAWVFVDNESLAEPLTGEDVTPVFRQQK